MTRAAKCRRQPLAIGKSVRNFRFSDTCVFRSYFTFKGFVILGKSVFPAPRVRKKKLHQLNYEREEDSVAGHP